MSQNGQPVRSSTIAPTRDGSENASHTRNPPSSIDRIRRPVVSSALRRRPARTPSSSSSVAGSATVHRDSSQSATGSNHQVDASSVTST